MAADRPRRAKPILIAGAAVITLALMGIGWVAWPRGTTEISHDDALEDFRSDYVAGDSADGSDAGTVATDDSSARPATPEPGVYTYTAEGGERVKLGPFPAEDRPLPASVSIVVSAPRAGTDSDSSTDETTGATGNTRCFDWTLNLFAEHTEATTWCIDDSGTLRMAAHTKHQSVGALSPTATVKCDPDVIIDPGTRESGLGCDLRLEGGPAAITAKMVGTATALPTERLTLGRSGAGDTNSNSTPSNNTDSNNTDSNNTEAIETTPLEITYTVSGDLSGTWSEKLWLSHDMLPVRIVRSLELRGPAAFTEHSTLELTQLSPTR